MFLQKTTRSLSALVLMLVGSISLSTNANANAQVDQKGKTQTLQILSKPYYVDKIYKSMQGPFSEQLISLSDLEPPELIWITAYRTSVVAEDGRTPANQEFLCHNNLDFVPHKTAQLFSSRISQSSRLFTLSQGLFAVELPRGFGIPVMSNQVLNLTTQTLNHNIKDPDITVRHLVDISYVRDRDVAGEMTALFSANAFVAALLEGESGDFGVSNASEIQRTASCLPGMHAGNSSQANIFSDMQGKSFSGHWVVPLGKETRRTLVTKIMNLPFDTKLHYIAVHVHPYSESLELRDLTANKTLFKSTMTGPKDRIGLTSVDTLSSLEGIPVYKDHDYELVSVYNNTSGAEQDAMATMLIYLQDTDFKYQ